MIAAAIDKILDMAKPVTVKVNNEEYRTERLHRVPKEMTAEPLEVSTLSSLVQYVTESKENKKKIPYLVHIISPTRVELISGLDGDRDREKLMIVNAETPKICTESIRKG